MATSSGPGSRRSKLYGLSGASAAVAAKARVAMGMGGSPGSRSGVGAPALSQRSAQLFDQRHGGGGVPHLRARDEVGEHVAPLRPVAGPGGDGVQLGRGHAGRLVL